MAEHYCMELERQLEAFYSDPITQEYGANDCDTLIIRQHLKKGCQECIEIIASAPEEYENAEWRR